MPDSNQSYLWGPRKLQKLGEPQRSISYHDYAHLQIQPPVEEEIKAASSTSRIPHKRVQLDTTVPQKSRSRNPSAVKSHSESKLNANPKTPRDSSREQSNSTHDSKNAQAPSAIPFFYNLYIPDDPNKTSLVMSIIEEQFTALKSSGATYRILVTIIGPETVDILKICRRLKLDCSIEQRFRRGAEEKTLDLVRTYCQNHPDETIIYAHDKGSQHARRGNNNYLRAFLLRAITSPVCHQMPDYCDACGAAYSPLPYAAYHGNMWVARCSYIRKLLTVEKVSDQMYFLRDKYIKNGTTKGRKIVCVDENGVSFPREWDGLPAGRPVVEHWIATHPDFRPCDIFDGKANMPTWDTQRTPRVQDWKIDLKPAPRYPLKNWTLPKMQLKDANYVWQGSLEKKLIQWEQLYQMKPANDSWVWKYYS